MAESLRIKPEAAAEIQRLERFARLMDSRFRIPGTKIRFGLDPLLGLIPFAGDTLSFLLQGALVLSMLRHGASGKVAVLMVLNIIFDYVLSNIPLLGNVLDFFYRSSDRNIRLLKSHYAEGRYQGSGTGVILLVIVVLMIVFVLVGFLFYKLLHWVISAF